MAKKRPGSKKRGRPRTKARVTLVPATFTITEITPACPGGARPGLDAEVIVTLQQLDTVVRDMRDGLAYPAGVWDEESAVQRYFLYVSMLTDVMLTDMVMSAVHTNDTALLMKQRVLVECAGKAAYFNAHPDYALAMMTIDETKSVLRKAKHGDSDPADIAKAQRDCDDAAHQFARVAHLQKKSFAEIMDEISTRREYVWLFGAPSALLHAEPEGLRQMLETMPDGSQRPRITLPLEQVNAILVDSGANMLMFCDRFVARFRPNDEPMLERIRLLDRHLKQLVLKHPYGRDQEALDAVTEELRAAANGAETTQP
jgi:hypothetical protein